MKPPAPILVWAATPVLSLLPLAARGQSPASPPPEVEARVTADHPDRSGRKIIMEQLTAPPAQAAFPAVQKPDAIRSPAAIRRPAAVVERRFLVVNATTYPNGTTLLQWNAPGAGGLNDSFEAWSLNDFTPLGLTCGFEINGTAWQILPLVRPASASDLQRPVPAVMDFPPGSNGFRLVKGGAADAKALEPILTLHELYRSRGAQISAFWTASRAIDAAEEARKKALAKPAGDVVIRIWPIEQPAAGPSGPPTPDASATPATRQPADQ